MSVRPDPREAIWYDLNNVLNLDAESVSHYWSILFDKFKLIDDGQVRPICLLCGSQDFVTCEKKEYCVNSIHKVYDENEEPQVYVIEGHTIINENLRTTIKRMCDLVFEELEDMEGYRMDLFELEDYMWGRPEWGFFETAEGDVRKSDVKRKLSKIKEVLLNRLIELREEIRFSATMRTPSLRM